MLCKLRGIDLVCGILLWFLATSEALIYFHYQAQPSSDELSCSVRTVQSVVEQHRLPVFLFGNGYMAPALELTAACVHAATHLSILHAIRIVAAVAFGLSAWALFMALRLDYECVLSFLISLFSIVGTPWLLVFVLKTPGYPVGVLSSYLYVYLVNRYQPGAVVLGLLSGFLYYLFPISVAFIVAAVIFRLPIRPMLIGVLERLRHCPHHRAEALLGWGLAGIFLLSSAISLYERLTGYSSAWRLWSAVGLSLLSGTLLLLILNRLRPFSHVALFAQMTCALALGIAAIQLPIGLTHRYVDLPFYKAHGIRVWTAGNSYQWKNWHNWPMQLDAYLEHIVPQSVVPLPQSQWFEVYSRNPRRGWRMGPGVLLAGGIAAMTALLVLGRGSLRIRRIESFFFTSFAVMSLLLLPSWRLFGDPSVRYLRPYFPALYLLGSVCFRNLFSRKQTSKSAACRVDRLTP
jgi:hypothetical protein